MFNFKKRNEEEISLEIDVFELKSRMDQSQDQLLLLDCREINERKMASIEPSLFIPMNEIPNRVAELESYKEKNIIVFCHGGFRSLKVAKWLRQQGFQNSQSLKQGIDGWSVQIDNQVPRY